MSLSPRDDGLPAALILAGGLGTRLRSAVADRPKVIAAVDGHPFMHFLFHQLAAAGYRTASLCTGYLAAQVQETLGRESCGLELRYVPEETPLGTAGAVRNALEASPAETYLILNGDSFCETSLTAFLAWHRQRQSRASLLLAKVPETSRFGRVDRNADGTVAAFREKGEAGPGWINAGMYLIERALLETIPTGVPCSLEREIFPGWVANALLAGYEAEVTRFIDIGTPESYSEAQEFFRGMIEQHDAGKRESR